MLKAKTKIEKTKEIAKKAHDKIQELLNVKVVIYTDGSEIDKKIDAAAYVSTSGEVSIHHLGWESQFNQYTAEITAMQLALERLWDYQIHRSCRIYTDSQTAIKAYAAAPIFLSIPEPSVYIVAALALGSSCILS